jgi:hypothetical protein
MAADVVLTTAHRTATYHRAVSDVIYRCPRRGCQSMSLERVMVLSSSARRLRRVVMRRSRRGCRRETRMGSTGSDPRCGRAHSSYLHDHQPASCESATSLPRRAHTVVPFERGIAPHLRARCRTLSVRACRRAGARSRRRTYLAMCGVRCGPEPAISPSLRSVGPMRYR